MPDPIKIKSVRFDFSMAKEEWAFELNSRWPTFFQSAFVRIVEGVLSCFDEPSHHLQIQRLELDLGTIEEADFYENFPRLLEEKLEEVMRQYLFDESHKKIIRQVARKQVLFDAFTWYLLKGYFPWHIDPKYKDLQILLKYLLQTNSQALRKFLFNYGHHTALRARLVLQLNDSQLIDLVELVEPSEKTFVISFFRFIMENYNNIEKPDIQKNEYRNATWNLIVTYLLEKKDTYFNRMDFVRNTIARLAGHYNMSFFVLLEYMVTDIPLFPQPYSGIPDLIRILNELKEEEIFSFASERKNMQNEDDGLLGEENKKMVEKLRDSLKAGESPKKLLHTLQKDLLSILLQPVSRREFLNGLHEEEIYRLTELTEPQEGSFIISYAQSLDREKEHGILEGRVGSEFRLLKWEFIFTALLEDRGSRFNRKSFIQSVLFMLSTHYNLTVRDLLDHLCHGIIEDNRIPHGELVSLLKEIYLEWKEDRKKECGVNLLDKAVTESQYASFLKGAPNSLKWRWVQVMSNTYVRTFVEEILMVQTWMEEIFREKRFGSFPGHLMINLLLDYVEGKYQHLNRQQFTAKMLQQLLEPLNQEKRKILTDNVLAHAQRRGGTLAIRLEQVLMSKETNENLAVDRANDLPGEAQSLVGVREEEFLEEIYIGNAGLVLLAPYFPRLFERLGLVEKGQFRGRDAQERALLSLQYLVDENTFFPEHELVLNKVLVGLQTGVPISPEIEFSDQEKEIMESLLQGVIQHWSALKNTSIQGFRESFLKRDGRLVLKDNGWHLVVEQKPYDMLLDRLPWSYSPIKHAWMKKILFVKWR